MKTSTFFQIFLLVIIFGTSSFLLFFRLNELMPFIGDQAWFYLSARDFIMRGEIPLVGITSSHTWLHQGPLWTYVLAVVLPLSNYNVLAPAVFTALGMLLTSFLMYRIGTKLFSVKVGILATGFFALSPLVIMNARMPYHTTLIPLFVLLLYFALVMWVKGKKRYFPLIFLLLGILYNLELATMVLWVLVTGIIAYGYYTKRTWFRNISNHRTVLKSIVFLLIPMVPILLYDVTHGFPQTVLFAGWIGYRIVQVIIPINPHPEGHSFLEVLSFLYQFNGRLLVSVNHLIALVLSLSSILWAIISLRQKQKPEFVILLLFVLVPFAGILLNKTPSEAYLPIFFPGIVLLISIFLSFLMKNTFYTFAIGAVVAIIFFLNAQWLPIHNYLIEKNPGYGVSLIKRIEIARKLTHEAEGRPFSVEEKGVGKKFNNTILNTVYLTWMNGNEARREQQASHFELYETPVSLSVIDKK